MQVIEIMQGVNRKRWITTTGLTLLPNKMIRGEFQLIAGYAHIVRDCYRWMLADVVKRTEDELAAEQRRFKWKGPEYRDRLTAKFEELMRDYPGLTREALETAGRVAATWPHDSRRQSRTICYEHHALLVTRSEAERKSYLDRAESEGWTAAELKTRLESAEVKN